MNFLFISILMICSWGTHFVSLSEDMHKLPIFNVLKNVANPIY